MVSKANVVKTSKIAFPAFTKNIILPLMICTVLHVVTSKGSQPIKIDLYVRVYSIKSMIVVHVTNVYGRNPAGLSL